MHLRYGDMGELKGSKVISVVLAFKLPKWSIRPQKSNYSVHIYPMLVDFRGSSVLKQLVVEQILDSTQVDCKTHIRRRFKQYVLHLLGAKDRDAQLEAGKEHSAWTVMASQSK